VKAVHYDQVGTALLWTLKQGLGNDWNEEVGEAWQRCYAILSGAMKRAAYATNG
jgi:hemoglobin-like flavoprotein